MHLFPKNHSIQVFRLALALLCRALLLAACGGEDSGKAQADADAPKPTPVTVVTLAPRDVVLDYEYPGRISAKESVEVRARVEGFLEKMEYAEGSLVKQGDLLFVIDERSYSEALKQSQADLSRSQAALDKAAVDERRFSSLVKQGVVSQEEYDAVHTRYREAQAARDASRASVEQARLNLGYCRVTAPIDGRAGKAQVKVGSLVGRSESTLLTTVDSIDPVYVDFSISEQEYLAYVREHQRKVSEGVPDPSPPLHLVLADGQEYGTVGTADVAQRTVDPTTGTLSIRGIFGNPDGLLLPGQYAKVVVPAGAMNGALLVPQRSVMDVQGKKSVYVVGEKGLLESRAVTLGPSHGGDFIVTGGLSSGDRVVVEGTQRLRPGMPVTPQAAPETPAPAGQAGS